MSEKCTKKTKDAPKFWAGVYIKMFYITHIINKYINTIFLRSECSNILVGIAWLFSKFYQYITNDIWNFSLSMNNGSSQTGNYSFSILLRITMNIYSSDWIATHLAHEIYQRHLKSFEREIEVHQSWQEARLTIHWM